MKRVLELARKSLRYNLRSLLLFELIFRLGTWIALIPTETYLLELCMELRGFRYITNQNILSFLAYPLTIVVLALGTVFVVCLAAVEYSSILVCCEYSVHGIKISLGEMFLEGLELSRRLFRRAKAVLLLLICLPIVNLWMLVVAVYKLQVLNYIAECIIVKKAGLWTLLIILLLWFLAASMTLLPLVAFSMEDAKEKRGLWRHIRFWNQGRALKNVKYFLIWNLSGVFWTVLCLVLLTVIASAVLLYTVSPAYIMARMIHAAEVLVITGGFMAGMIGTMVHLSGTYALHYTLMEGRVGRLEMKRRFANDKELLRPKKKKITLSLLLIVALVETVMITVTVFHGNYNVSDYLTGVSVTAHRGASKLAPENTLSALQTAIDLGADYAEIDVQESKDGVLFLMHDTSLARTTNSKQQGFLLNYSELLEIDAGSWFGKEFAGEHIPTLEEALELCRGRIKLNIEIKYNSNTPDIVQHTVEMIERMNFEEQCVITCTRQDCLKQVKEYNADIKTGMILKVSVGKVSKLEGVDFFSAKYTNVTSDFVVQAHALGLEVHVWTVNNFDMVREMAALGVDSIITDYPLETIQVLHEEEHGIGFTTVLKKIIQQFGR